MGDKPTWAELHAKGLTAKEAAEACGSHFNAAYLWSSKNGVQWAQPKPAGDVQWQGLFDAGLTAAEAANSAGKTVPAARNWAKKRGVKWARPKRKRRRKSAADKMWRKMFRAGMNAIEAAEQSGRNITCAYSWARRNGVKWPRPTRPSKPEPTPESTPKPQPAPASSTALAVIPAPRRLTMAEMAKLENAAMRRSWGA